MEKATKIRSAFSDEKIDTMLKLSEEEPVLLKELEEQMRKEPLGKKTLTNEERKAVNSFLFKVELFIALFISVVIILLWLGGKL